MVDVVASYVGAVQRCNSCVVATVSRRLREQLRLAKVRAFRPPIKVVQFHNCDFVYFFNSC